MKKVPKYTVFLLIKLLKSSPLRFARALCFRKSNAKEIRGGNSSTSGETDVIHVVGDNRFSSRKKKTAVFFEKHAESSSLSFKRLVKVGKLNSVEKSKKKSLLEVHSAKQINSRYIWIIE